MCGCEAHQYSDVPCTCQCAPEHHNPSGPKPIPDPLAGPGGTAPDGTVFKLPGEHGPEDYVLFTDVEKIFEEWLTGTALPNVREHGPDALLSPSVAADFIGTIHQFGRRPGGETRYT